ncbi:MAG: hypothetical protein C4527_11580 [Candidatus Omnitrophota bacterium]|nr:MAG: hypothetical protein C4527_11580 [Candidatus Omnitrophota bacterium]
MKAKWIVFLVLFGCVLQIGALAVEAQEKAKFVLVIRDQVKPGLVDEYLAAVKEYCAAFQENEYPFPFFTARRFFDFEYAIFMDDLNLNQLLEAGTNIQTIVGKDQWASLQQRIMGTLDSESSWIEVFRPDLSYYPENPLFEFDPQQPCLMSNEICFLIPGKEKENEKLITQYVELCKEKQYPVAFGIYQVVIGADTPIYSFVTAWKDEEAMLEGKKLESQLGEEARAIVQKGLEITRRYERREYMYLPELSYTPGQKTTTAAQKAETGFQMIDLSDHFNHELKGSFHPSSGYTDDTPNDLAELPTGEQTFADVPFHVQKMILLLGIQLELVGGEDPKRVEEIEVGKKFETMHVLHACAWQAPEGSAIGSFILHYTDGGREKIDINYGEHVLDWWGMQGGELDSENSEIVWRGKNALIRAQEEQGQSVEPLRLFKTTWKNPRPDQEVTSIDYVSTMSDAAPFLLAITVE